MITAWMLSTLVACGAEPARHTLISVNSNTNKADWSLSSKEAAPSLPHTWRVTKRRLSGGKQEGVDVVEIDNGKLKIVVVPTRGMGIWSVTSGNIRLGWDSPVKEIVHPSLVSLQARGGLGWLDGFGELMCRCGLENNGHPGRDVIVDNTGAESTVDLTLHGKQAYLPAQEVEFIADAAPPYTLRLRGLVGERMVHGPKLRLETEIATEPGSSHFRVSDTIVNESASPAEFQILYHTNFGAPLLEQGSEFVAPVKRVVPFNARAAEGDIADFANYSGPTQGFVEQVYCVELFGAESGETVAGLVNRGRDAAASLRFRLESLPYLTLWKNTAAVADGYVTGIEPGTNYPYTRRLERKAGRVPTLAPGASRNIAIEISLHDGLNAVDELTREISQIQGGRKPEYVTRPMPPEEAPQP